MGLAVLTDIVRLRLAGIVSNLTTRSMMKGRSADFRTVSWRCSVTPEVRSVTFTGRFIDWLCRWMMKPCETRVGRLVEDQGGPGGSGGSGGVRGGPADALALDWRGIVWDLLPGGYLNSVGDSTNEARMVLTRTLEEGQRHILTPSILQELKNVEWYANMTNFNLTWPVTLNYVIQILKLDYGTKLEIIRFVLRDET